MVDTILKLGYIISAIGAILVFIPTTQEIAAFIICPVGISIMLICTIIKMF